MFGKWAEIKLFILFPAGGHVEERKWQKLQKQYFE